MSSRKTLIHVRDYVRRIAERNGWKLHDDHDGTLELLVEGLRDNFNRLGYYNCPCRESQEDPKLDRDIICPCRYSRLDVEEFGHCYCALYFDPQFDFSMPIVMIPERRLE